MRVCVFMCRHVYTHVLTSVLDLFVCRSGSSTVATRVEFVCLVVCAMGRQRKRVHGSVFVWFDGGVEPPRDKGDAAVAIHPNTSKEFPGWIMQKDEGRGEQQHHQKAAEEIFLAFSAFL